MNSDNLASYVDRALRGAGYARGALIKQKRFFASYIRHEQGIFSSVVFINYLGTAIDRWVYESCVSYNNLPDSHFVSHGLFYNAVRFEVSSKESVSESLANSLIVSRDSVNTGIDEVTKKLKNERLANADQSLLFNKFVVLGAMYENSDFLRWFSAHVPEWKNSRDKYSLLTSERHKMSPIIHSIGRYAVSRLPGDFKDVFFRSVVCDRLKMFSLIGNEALKIEIECIRKDFLNLVKI